MPNIKYNNEIIGIYRLLNGKRPSSCLDITFLNPDVMHRFFRLPLEARIELEDHKEPKISSVKDF